MHADQVALTAKVRCSGKLHRVVVTRGGAIVLPDHTPEELQNSEALIALGGEGCRCLIVMKEIIALRRFIRQHCSQRGWSRDVKSWPRGSGLSVLAPTMPKKLRQAIVDGSAVPIRRRYRRHDDEQEYEHRYAFSHVRVNRALMHAAWISGIRHDLRFMMRTKADAISISLITRAAKVWNDRPSGYYRRGGQSSSTISYFLEYAAAACLRCKCSGLYRKRPVVVLGLRYNVKCLTPGAHRAYILRRIKQNKQCAVYRAEVILSPVRGEPCRIVCAEWEKDWEAAHAGEDPDA